MRWGLTRYLNNFYVLKWTINTIYILRAPLWLEHFAFGLHKVYEGSGLVP